MSSSKQPARSSKESEKLDHNGSSASGRDSAPARRWDDPPESEPLDPQEPDRYMILAVKQKLKMRDTGRDRDVQQICFTPSSSHIIAMAPHVVNASIDPAVDSDSMLSIWSMADGNMLQIKADHRPRVSSGFAFPPLPACAVTTAVCIQKIVPAYSPYPLKTTSLYTFDLLSQKRIFNASITVQAPMVYSPDGVLFAAVSVLNPSRYQINLISGNNLTIQRVVPHHIDQVTHLAFMPDSTAIISLSKDGTGRMTSVSSGRVLRKFAVQGRHNPSLLQVSPDGELVASVWGWLVALWYPGADRLVTYDFETMHHREGWPLAISPDCRYLVCRVEGGFDVSDLVTGKFLGEVTGERDTFATAAAFSPRSNHLAVGKMNGDIVVYDTVEVT